MSDSAEEVPPEQWSLTSGASGLTDFFPYHQYLTKNVFLHSNLFHENKGASLFTVMSSEQIEIKLCVLQNE